MYVCLCINAISIYVIPKATNKQLHTKKTLKTKIVQVTHRKERIRKQWEQTENKQKMADLSPKIIINYIKCKWWKYSGKRECHSD